jgi:hypothetical protein
VHKNAVRGWTWKKTAPVQNYLGVSLTSLISWTNYLSTVFSYTGNFSRYNEHLTGKA